MAFTETHIKKNKVYVLKERNIMGKKQQSKDSFGERIKAYENVNRTYLTDGVPKVMRLDGKAFHSFLKGAERPYDKNVMMSMAFAAAKVLKEIGGSARFAYIQSDEVSIGINDKMTIESSPWFGNNVQKMVSVSSSIMAVNFSYEYYTRMTNAAIEKATTEIDGKRYVQLMVGKPNFRPAYFDARIFQVPNVVELHNAVLWRQQDAAKNSISQYARSFFSHKEVDGKNGSEMQEMMHSVHGFNWNDAPTWTKRGILLYRLDREQMDCTISERKSLEKLDGNIVLDWEIPKFSEANWFLSDIFNAVQKNNEV